MADFSSLKFELDNWTLASDERFLNQMKAYFGDVMNRIGVVDRLADTIDYNSTLVHSVINSSFNTLSNLSNSCFLENAMEEQPADAGLRKSVIQGTPKPTSNFEANLIGNFAKAVKLGMDGLDILKAIEDDGDDRGSVMSSQGTKFDRLPAIVGSKIFKDEDFLGIIEKMEEPPMNMDFNTSMIKDLTGQQQPDAIGMNQSISLNQSQQQINTGPNLNAPNLNQIQSQNNLAQPQQYQPPQNNNIQPPSNIQINLQQPNLNQQSNLNQQTNSLQPPPKLNPSGPVGNLPPPNLGLLLAQKEQKDKVEKENRVHTQTQEHHEPPQQQQQQPTRSTGAPQMSIADALKMRFAGNQQQPQQQQQLPKPTTFNQSDLDNRPVTFNQEDTRARIDSTKKVNEIANNPMYRLNQPKNLNNMFDDDDQDDDFGNDLFKPGNKKKNKFQDLLSGNPVPTKSTEEPIMTKKETPNSNPLRQEPVKEMPKAPVMKDLPTKKNALFTDTETDNDVANIKTDNKKLKNMFADSDNEQDVVKKGKQLADLYKKDVQPEQPKKVSKLFMDEDDSPPQKKPLFDAQPSSSEKFENKLDYSREESKGMEDIQISSSRPSVTKVSGRISDLHNKLNINMDSLKIQGPSAKPYQRPSLKNEGSTTPRGGMQEINPETKGEASQVDDNYTEMLMNKGPVAVRKTKKLDFDDSDSDSNKWSGDDDSGIKKKNPPQKQPVKVEEKPQPIKIEEKPQPIANQNDQKGEISPRNFKFEDSKKDYFGKNELLGGEMTVSVTSTKLADKQQGAQPKENPMDLLKNLNQPLEKTKPKKEEAPKKETIGGASDSNNPLALLNGLKTMDKQHKKDKKATLFNDDDDDDGLFKKAPPKKSANLWGDEPSEPKKTAPAKKNKLFDDSDDDTGSFFKKPAGEIVKPTLVEPKKDVGSKPKRPLWDDSD